MSEADQAKPISEAKETRGIVRHGFEIARELGIKKVLAVAALLGDRKLVDQYREDEEIIWVTDKPEKIEAELEKRDRCVTIPQSPAGRMDQVSLALIVATMDGFIMEDESVVCLLGASGSKRLDNMLIANPKRDFEWFSEDALRDRKSLPISREFVRLVDVALKFSAQGREGKSIGTVFALGDLEELEAISSPLILNPLAGHPKKTRSIFDDDFVETIREFSALDGGFLVDRKGIVASAGVYLDAPITKKVKVQKGLGSRHLAAAAATAKTNSIAIVISESSGTVTVFFDGSKVLSLNRPS